MDNLLTTITVVADTVGHVLNEILDISAAFTIHTEGKIDPATKKLEIISLLLSSISWGFSVPFERSLTFKKDDLEASMETLLWGYRGFLLGADIITLIVGETKLKGARRLRRLNPNSVTFWGVTSAVDMVLAIAYLATVDEDNTAIKVADILSEIVSWVANIASLALLSKDPRVALGVPAIANISAMFLTPALGLVVIIEDAKALRAA